MKKRETTLLFLRKEDKILLAMKKRGFGKDKFNGVGGKLEENESPEMAMIRESQEEILVTPTRFEKMGTLDFIEFYKGNKQYEILHLFVATEWVGEPQESDEMKPQWFNINEIPYDRMFPDDKFWLPLFLENKKVKCFFEFDENWNLLSQKVETVEEV